MALFADIETDAAREYGSRPRRGAQLGWFLLIFAILGITVVAFLPAPYVVEQPGPVFDTLGAAQAGAKEVPLIEIEGETTYPTAGTLSMLTVTIYGNRQNQPSWIEIAAAWLDPSKAVLPLDRVYPEGVTVEQSAEQSRVEMLNSQQEAIAAALAELDYSYSSTLSVAQTMEGSPADEVLEEGDIIKSLNGHTFADVSELREAIAENGTDEPATIVVERDGGQLEFEVTPVMSEGEQAFAVIGILVGSDYEFPVDVEIQLENVGGPSAGMMFALGIIDKLTPGKLNGGEAVAGTGTITAAGDVGPIGGIRQKMYGALNAGNEWFLAPEANCNEVVGHVPEGLSVYAVGTLDEALVVLEAIESGEGLDALDTCTAA